MHFLTSQVVVDHLGYICRMTIAPGHNNDQGMFNLTRMAEWLEQRQLGPLLADLGYRGDHVVRPVAAEEIVLGEHHPLIHRSNHQQAAERSLVENVNSWFKNWKFAKTRCKMSPELQAMALVVCGMLNNLTIDPDAYRRANLLGRR
jgi:transposase